jgi:glycosyltransferase involved in cell wall biosynthesis
MLDASETAPQAPAAAAPAPPVPGRLLVLIPARNEQTRIGAVVTAVRRELEGVDVLVVNDGSSDATAEEAARAGARVLTLPLGLGYGAALQTGYKYALRHDYDAVAQMDGDGQHDAAYLPTLLAGLGDPDVDVVLGSRFLDGDGHYRPSAARKVGMSLFGRIASVVTRQRVTDPTSGFQVMRMDVVRFFCTAVYPADYPDADILILLHRSGFRVREVGVRMLPPPGKSMHSGHRSLYYVYKMSLSILVTMLARGTGKSRP